MHWRQRQPRSETDCTGSTVTSYVFNPLDQLVSATQGTASESHAYDPAGRRMQSTRSSATTHYLYQGADIHGEYDGNWGTPQALHVQGPGWDQPLMRLTGPTSGPGATARYYAQDGLGNVVAYFGDLMPPDAELPVQSVSTTGDFSAEVYPPGKLIDGDSTGNNGTWAGSSNNLATNPASFTLELGSVVKVSRIKLYSADVGSSQYHLKDADVQIRDGAGQWRTVGSLANNSVDDPEIPLDNAEGSAVKVLVKGALGGDIVILAEAEVIQDGGAQSIALQRFDAWGNKTASAGETIPGYGYTGREPGDAAIGLVYYRARYYDPSIGRFISRDPAGMPDGVNRYAYVRNSPVMYVDQMGLMAQDPFVVAQGGTSYFSTTISDAGGGLYTSGSQSLRNAAPCPGNCHVDGFDPGTPMLAEQQRQMGTTVAGIALTGIAGGAVASIRGGALLMDLGAIANSDGPVAAKGLTKADFAEVGTEVSQKQLRHVAGRPELEARGGGSYLNSKTDAQVVLDAYHSGSATILGKSSQGFPVVRVESVTGTNVNIGAGFPNQPTNVFIIKGTASPSVVPTNPNWMQ